MHAVDRQTTGPTLVNVLRVHLPCRFASLTCPLLGSAPAMQTQPSTIDRATAAGMSFCWPKHTPLASHFACTGSIPLPGRAHCTLRSSCSFTQSSRAVHLARFTIPGSSTQTRIFFSTLLHHGMALSCIATIAGIASSIDKIVGPASLPFSSLPSLVPDSRVRS